MARGCCTARRVYGGFLVEVPPGHIAYPGSDVRGYGSYGATFCRDLEPPLAELKALLPVARAAGVDTTSAQAVYDDLNGYIVYLPIGDACAKHTAEAIATVNKLRSAIAAAGTKPPAPIRPDYAPSDNPGGSAGLPSWLKYVAIAGVSAYLLAQLKVFVPAKRAAR